MKRPRTNSQYATWQGWAIMVVLFAVYFACGKLGLKLAFVNSSASAVWPPSGIALAAFLLFGYYVFPSVLLGAFFVNYTTTGHLASSVAIAIGNTAEGLLAAYLILRFAGGQRVFDTPRTIPRFVLLGPLFATFVSALVGVSTLVAFGLAPWAAYGSIFLTWWLGDAVAMLTVTPLILLWWNRPAMAIRPFQVFEGVLLIVAVLLAGLLSFSDLFQTYPLEFLFVPIIIWTGFRFRGREVITVILAFSVMAIAGTLSGLGPFTLASENESLLFLQTFMGTMAFVGLSVAALVREHRLFKTDLIRLQQENAHLKTERSYRSSLRRQG